MSEVALCVIARDEAAALPGLLASVQDAVQHIIVVDTGSADGTVALAREAGAQVVETPWTADFSAARNAALPALAASGARWMLVLDADERLAPGAGAALAAAVAADDFDRGLVPFHNASDAAAAPAAVLSGRSRRGEPTLLARLFRVGPGLRYAGAVHERVPADWLGRPSRDRVLAGVDVIHLGYADDRDDQEAKAARNLVLLRQQCAAAPDDPICWSYRARDAQRAGLPDEAAAAADRAWALLRARGLDRGAPVPVAAFTLAALRADLQLQRADLAAATETAETAAGWAAGHPSVWLVAGVAHLHAAVRSRGPGPRRRHLQAARGWLDRCLAAHGRLFRDELSAGSTSWLAACRRAEVELVAGAPDRAAPFFAVARRTLPARRGGLAGAVEVDVVLGEAECALAAGRWQGALQAVEPVLPLPIGDGWALAARACRVGGMAAEAQAFAARAGQATQWRGPWRRS